MNVCQAQGWRLPALLAPLLILALPLPGAEAQPGLATDSPFMLVSDAATVAAQPNAVELRGVLSRQFNLVDTTTRKGAWVALNEPGPQGWVVRSHEQTAEGDVVTVENAGRSLRLPLARPRTGKAAPPAVAQGPAQPVQGPVTPVILNPTPAQQAKAQEDIMAEVRRRRLQRQMNASQQQAPQPPPAQPQQAAQPGAGG